jgi:hypothetical protein
VRARWRWISAGAVAVLVWLGLAYCAAPPDAHEYRRTAVQSAQAALAAVRTVVLAGPADRDGKLFPPYLSALIDDEAGAVTSAERELAAEPPPDAGTRAVRDQLTPLLVEAGRQIADLDAAESAGDRPALAAHLDALRAIGDRLDAFVERYR